MGLRHVAPGGAIRSWMLLLVGFGAAGCNGSPGPDRIDATAVRAASEQADPLGAAVLNAAQGQVRSFLDRIPRGHEGDYGFSDRAAFGRASLGAPLRLLTFEPAALAAAAPEWQAMDVWRVPLWVDGHARALLTVAETNTGLTVVELGATGLAAELESWERNWNAARSPAQWYLLRIFQLRCDFAVLAAGLADPDPLIVPLESARRGLGLEPLSAGQPGPSRQRLVELLTTALREHPPEGTP